MNTLLKAVCIFLIQYQVISHFFHFDNFLEPIINPLTDKLVNIQQKNSNKITDNLSPQMGTPTQQDKKNNKKPVNKSNQEFYGRKKDEKYNMRAEDYLAKDLYQMIGIPENIIYKKLIPVHMEARHDLNCYFYKGSNSKRKLYQKLVQLREIINQIFDNYLKKYQSLIIGDSNIAIGSHIFLFADKHTIIGNQDIIFNTQYPEDVIRGDNIVRISRFDVNLEKLERVLINPYDAITLLQE